MLFRLIEWFRFTWFLQRT